MNERIEALLIEAHRQTEGGIYNGHLSVWTEKFAELIVKECAGIVTDAVDHREPASTYADRIQQHFGVE